MELSNRNLFISELAHVANQSESVFPSLTGALDTEVEGGSEVPTQHQSS
jgi:hypothetical protein